MAVIFVLIYFISASIGSIPGLWALSHKRPLLGLLMIAGALVVTTLVAIFLDRESTRAAAESGVFRDDIAGLFIWPPLLGVLYLFVTAILYVVIALFALLIKRRARQAQDG